MLSVKFLPLKIGFLLYYFPLCLVQAQDSFSYVNPLELDYTIYPVGARQCVLNHVMQLSCNRANVVTWNGCICNNGENILFKAASCVKEASAGDMASSYSALKALCDGTGTPISVSFQQWMNTEAYVSVTRSGESMNSATHSVTQSAAYSATHSATDSVTPSASGSTTENGGAGGGGLSKSDQIAIGACVSGGVLALIGVIIAWRTCRRQGQTARTRR